MRRKGYLRCDKREKEENVENILEAHDVEEIEMQECVTMRQREDTKVK